MKMRNIIKADNYMKYVYITLSYPKGFVKQLDILLQPFI